MPPAPDTNTAIHIRRTAFDLHSPADRLPEATTGRVPSEAL